MTVSITKQDWSFRVRIRLLHQFKERKISTQRMSFFVRGLCGDNFNTKTKRVPTLM